MRGGGVWGSRMGEWGSFVLWGSFSDCRPIGRFGLSNVKAKRRCHQSKTQNKANTESVAAGKHQGGVNFSNMVWLQGATRERRE